MNPLRSWLQQFHQACTGCSQHLHLAASTRSLTRMQGFRKRLSRKKGRELVVLAIATITLTSALGQNFYNQPRLSVGKIAPETIRAPGHARVEDQQATEEKRKAVRSFAVPVYTIDIAATDQAQQTIQGLLIRGTALRQHAGAFPFMDSRILSEPIQRYLRKAQEWEWRLVLNAAQERSSSAKLNDFGNPDRLGVQLSNPLQRQAADELQRSSTQSADGLWGVVKQISSARQKYMAAIADLQSPLSSSETAFDPTVFDISDAAWKEMQANLTQASDRMLTQGIPPGLPPNQLEQAIQLHLNATPPETRAIASQMLVTALKPNLVRDDAQTRVQTEKAALEVPPVIVEIDQGEIITEAGKIITAHNFVLLDHFNLSRRETNWLGLIGFSGLVSGAVVLFWQIEQRFHVKGLRNRDYWLIWFMTVSTPLLVIVNAPSTNLPAIGFLMGTFYDSLLSVTLVGLLTLVLPIGMGIEATQWFPSAVAGLLVAVFAARVRSREEVAFLGLGVGVTQGALYLIVGAISGVSGYGLLGKAAIEASLGLAWSIVAMGISPYLEHVFDIVTTLRLVELANPNRPLLKRLAAETPGTFQHTLFVANLAEAAAKELGCNVELVRTGTLYHDIGKMHDPMGFIENQMGGTNKHDELNDPWLSADIIKKHVTEGLVMARKARLPKAVQAFIPEHQGTMPISYFYHQAKERALGECAIAVNEADFRYEGPTPQSRETGVVMLADSCEAALRSLKDATPEEAHNMINKILAARWKDGQLDDSGLSREEMSTIAQVFVRVWQQSNHQRIAYPKLSSK